MVEIAESHKKAFEKAKDNVELSSENFKENRDRYNKYRRFIFENSVNDDDAGVLEELDRPIMQINILEAYISRLIGEWSKQTPDFKVRAANSTVPFQQVKIVESHLRSISNSSHMQSLQKSIYNETMSGGYSVMKVFTDYENDHSFDQAIRLDKTYDPTLCGFDPMARKSHKGDGQYCFELFPKTESEFKQEYPNIDISKVKYAGRELANRFDWGYMDGMGTNRKKILYICDYYEKKEVKVDMVLVNDPMGGKPKTMTLKEYESMIEGWDQMSVPPEIIKEAKRTKQEIWRYKFIGTELLERPVKTEFSYLPLVFFDGNSHIIKNKQVTRPYVYQAMDAQRMKNLAASAMMNDLENMRQTDVMITKRAIPEEPEYRQAWLNPQRAHAALIYEDKDQEEQLPPPTILPRNTINPALMQIFDMQDKTIQSVLGSYDAQLGIQEKQLSGVAIVEGATQSNNAAMPYVANFLESMNQIANILVDLIPKFYTTMRTIPIVTDKGEHAYVDINGKDNQGNPINTLDYEKNDLEVMVKAGVNFDVQKNRSLQTVVQLMQVSETFKGFMESEGLSVLLDNIDIRDQDQLKQMSEQFMAQRKKAQQQQGNQPNPAQMQMQLAQQDMQLKQQRLQLDAQKMQNEKEIEQMKLAQSEFAVIQKAQEAKISAGIRYAEAQTEQDRTQAELAMKASDQMMKHMEIAAKPLLDIAEN